MAIKKWWKGDIYRRGGGGGGGVYYQAVTIVVEGRSRLGVQQQAKRVKKRVYYQVVTGVIGTGRTTQGLTILTRAYAPHNSPHHAERAISILLKVLPPASRSFSMLILIFSAFAPLGNKRHLPRPTPLACPFSREGGREW